MTQKIQAAVLVEPRRFELELRRVPDIQPDEVLLEVARCGICGTDTHIYDGGFMAHRLPLVPGHEFSCNQVRRAVSPRALRLWWILTTDAGAAITAAVGN